VSEAFLFFIPESPDEYKLLAPVPEDLFSLHADSIAGA